MPRTSAAEKKFLADWRTRVSMAEKAYEKWERKYRPDVLEEYYYGHQWDNVAQADEYQLYWVNIFFSNIESRQPSLLFYRPRVRLLARPNKLDDPGSMIDDRVRLLEDTANTFISDRRNSFLQEIGLGLQESFFRFGVVEVGYTADIIDNPNASTPILDRGGRPVEDPETHEPMMHPPKVIREESVFFKWIPARQFRTSLRSHNVITKNDWVGYWEWYPLQDVKADKRLNGNRHKIKPGGKITKDYDFNEPFADPEYAEAHRDMVKLWKIWDLRSMQKFMFDYAFEHSLLGSAGEGEEFEFLPVAVLKFNEILGNFYALPPSYNWKPLQDEKNEIREMKRIHRKRFVRRYLRDPRVRPDEWDKLEKGGDGVCAEVSNPVDAVVPIPDAPLDRTLVINSQENTEDLMLVSGLPGEHKGVSEADTATQASIIDTNARIRESRSRIQVGDWIAEIVTIMLKTIVRRMSLPFWVRVNTDLQSPMAAQETTAIAQAYQSITASDLPDDFNWEVSVDIETLTPATEDRQRQQWVAVLQILTQPPLLAILMASDVLLRKTLNLYGIRNEKEVQEVRRAMQAVMTGMMTAQMAAGGPPGAPPGPPGNGGIGPGQAPGFEQIAQQLMGQTGLQAR